MTLKSLKSLKSLYFVMKAIFVEKPLLGFGTVAVFVLSSAMISLQLQSIKKVVDALFHGMGMNLLIWLTVLILSYLTLILANTVKPLLEFHIREWLNFKYPLEFIQKSLRTPMVSFDSPEFYDKLNRAREDSQTKMADLLRLTLLMFSAIFNVFAVVATLIQIHPWLIVMIAASSFPGFYLTIQTGKKTHAVNRYQTPEWRLHYYLNRLISTKENAREVRVLGIQDYLYQMWSKLGNTIRNQTRDIEIQHAKRTIFTDMLAKGANLVCLAILGSMFIAGSITIGSIALIFRAIRYFQENMFQFMESASQLYTHSLFIEDIFVFLGTEEEKETGRDSTSHGASHNRTGHGHRLKRIETIEFQNVSFYYPGAATPALDQVNFVWRFGEKIALVGENGAGKSTFVHLLLGLYKPTTGQVRVNGIPLEELNLQEYYERITATFQDFNKYSFSFRENITLGRKANDQLISEIAEQMNMSDLLRERGLNAQLGSEFGGGELSGGQWQKLAICRSLYRQPDMIIMDEPTASLDPIAEVEIFKNIADLSDSMGVLLISHRLGSAKQADRIIFLEKGRIVEEGSHDTLMEIPMGKYRDLYNIQAEWYKEGIQN